MGGPRSGLEVRLQVRRQHLICGILERGKWRKALSRCKVAGAKAAGRGVHKALPRWSDKIDLSHARQFNWSFLPPLMIYAAAGISGLTTIVGTFFVKEHLGLSAAFLASITFWAGLPWALKMPIGHIVDLMWRCKDLLVYFGAFLICLSMAVMYGLIAYPQALAGVMSTEAWFVLSTLLAPTGYVIQDVIADAMTVEAVPVTDVYGNPRSDAEVKAMHTTMQTLGRVATIGGFVPVALLNIVMFANVDAMSTARKISIYGEIYLLALLIPLVSVVGVTLANVQRRRRARAMQRAGVDEMYVQRLLFQPSQAIKPNWWILFGSLFFVAFTIGMGLSGLKYSQEVIFLGSMLIVVCLIHQLTLKIDRRARRALLGTAIIIFAFRAVPLPGPGATWFEIDVLGFDQQFLSVLSLIGSGLTLAGMFVLRPVLAKRSLAYVIALLAAVSAVLSLPNIALYFGIHEWTAIRTGGIVNARFIALVDTTLESPLGQIAMIPMLAWIAKNAPVEFKATFFAVMASFTNLALSASSLATKYLNQIWVVAREVRDPVTGALVAAADYSQLGWLLISVTLISAALPLTIVGLVQWSPLMTRD
jgi:hypothetical protein